MDEHARLHERPGRALLGFSLGTFTAVALVLGTIGLAHARGSLGDLLNGLNIAVGLLSFAVLWAVSAYASTTALRCLTLDPAPPWSRVVLRAAGAGGTIGAAIAAAGVLVLIVLAMVPAMESSSGSSPWSCCCSTGRQWRRWRCLSAPCWGRFSARFRVHSSQPLSWRSACPV